MTTPSEQPQFNTGNRVRLKANPEISGIISLTRSRGAEISYQVRYDNTRKTEWHTAEELEMLPPAFNIGDQVSPRQTPSKVGMVMNYRQRRNGNYEYEVFFASNDISWYPETSLIAAKPPDTSPKVIDGNKFLRDLGLIKLESNLSDTLYSYRASRTKVEPYQFKPAIKFFESFNQRLLIADEVGLGKTIEAGIIYLELNARNDLKRVLVICPSSLREKWRDEMRNRFSEDFQIMDATRFREQLDRYREYGDAVRLKSIVSMETIRRRDIADLMEEVGFAPNLVIIDEAHHMRNRDTLTHHVGRMLSDVSDHLLMLTATPIQLRSEDLFNLFRILDEGEFNDLQEFEQLREPNTHINRASQILSNNSANYPQALKELRQVESTVQKDRYVNNPLYKDILRRLTSTTNPGIKDMVELQRDLQQLNTFAPIFNRTTKKQVSPGIPRTPQVIHVDLTPNEMDFYDSLLDFFRQRSTSILPIIQHERAAASCIAAAREYIRDSIANPTSSLQIQSNNPNLTNNTQLQIRLDELEDACNRLGETDSKYEKFVEALNHLRSESPNGKVLVFAYFKRTLEYLRRKLNESTSPFSGSVHMIHGDVKQEDRIPIIETFRDDPEFSILLLSEVGAEGMDFQFSDTVFNYDLPWNPMRVEQRIGRVDRYGQESKRIRVYSLVLNDTIEERILARLYERINVFRESIGDMEAILGDAISQLQREVFQSKLTPQQQKQLAKTMSMSAVVKRMDLDLLQKNQDSLMGQDIIFEQQFDDMEKGGKFVSGIEIKALVDEFIKKVCPQSSLRRNPRHDQIFILRAAADLRSNVRRSSADIGFPTAIMATLNEKMQNHLGFPITFNGELGLQRPNLELLNLQHPIVAAAIKHFQGGEKVLPRYRLGNATITTDDPELAGEYGFFIYHIQGSAAYPLSSLVPIVINLDTHERAERIEADLLSSLQKAQYQRFTPQWDWDELKDLSREHFADYRDNLLSEMETRNNSIIDARIAGLKLRHAAKISRLKYRLAQANNSNIQRMLRGQISNTEDSLQPEIDILESKRGIDISHSLVLAGYIQYK